MDAMAKAFLPERRIIDIAPNPEGVDGAIIVLDKSDISIALSLNFLFFVEKVLYKRLC